MKCTMALPRPFRSQDGFAMIEAIVSATVLAMVAIAVLSGIDNANGSSAREKARAVAANLAEQDQERMRGMTVDALAAVSQVPAITVDGATYKIKSEASFVTDDQGGTPSCGNTSNRSQYIHITTTVTSAIVGVRVPPVKIDSLVSPSVAYSQNHGSLGVKITDRNDAPVPNVSVSGTGTSVLTSQTTDANGCVIWKSVPIGTYSVSVNMSGYGTTDGDDDAAGAHAPADGQPEHGQLREPQGRPDGQPRPSPSRPTTPAPRSTRPARTPPRRGRSPTPAR